MMWREKFFFLLFFCFFCLWPSSTTLYKSHSSTKYCVCIIYNVTMKNEQMRQTKWRIKVYKKKWMCELCYKCKKKEWEPSFFSVLWWRVKKKKLLFLFFIFGYSFFGWKFGTFECRPLWSFHYDSVTTTSTTTTTVIGSNKIKKNI